MSQPTSRRAFLKGSMLRQSSGAIHPPGAVEDGFADLCTACGDCAGACPEDAIKLNPGAFPVVDVSDASCTFCGDCARSCPTGALEPDRVADWPWRASIVAASCLSQNGVSCRLCQDNCDQGAIRFRLQPGGRSAPLLDIDTCIGCGACATACPAGAVELKRFVTDQPEMVQ